MYSHHFLRTVRKLALRRSSFPSLSLSLSLSLALWLSFVPCSLRVVRSSLPRTPLSRVAGSSAIDVTGQPRNGFRTVSPPPSGKPRQGHLRLSLSACFVRVRRGEMKSSRDSSFDLFVWWIKFRRVAGSKGLINFYHGIRAHSCKTYVSIFVTLYASLLLEKSLKNYRSGTPNALTVTQHVTDDVKWKNEMENFQVFKEWKYRARCQRVNIRILNIETVTISLKRKENSHLGSLSLKSPLLIYIVHFLQRWIQTLFFSL